MTSNLTEALIPLDQRVANVLAVTPILIFGVGGNVVVIFAVLSSRRNSRSTRNAFVLLLALADLVFLLSATLPNLARYATGSRKWLMPNLFCQACVFFSYASANAGSLIIACFSVFRLIAVCWPDSWAGRISFSKQTAFLTLILILSGIYSSTWIFSVGVTSLQCTFLHDRKQYLVIYLVDFASFFVIPVVIMVVANGILVRKIVKVRQVACPPPENNARFSSFSQYSMTSSINSCYSSSVAPTLQTRNRFPSRSVSESQTATKMLIAVSIVFIITCLPYRLFMVMNSLFPKEDYVRVWLIHTCRWLWYANSAINPMVYSLISKRFRDTVSKLLTVKTRSSRKVVARRKHSNRQRQALVRQPRADGLKPGRKSSMTAGSTDFMRFAMTAIMEDDELSECRATI